MKSIQTISLSSYTALDFVVGVIWYFSHEKFIGKQLKYSRDHAAESMNESFFVLEF